MMIFPKFLLLLPLLVSIPSWGLGILGVGLGSGFGSLQATDLTGATYKSATIARFDFKPEYFWLDRATYSELGIEGRVQYFKFGATNDDIVVSQAVAWCFGARAHYSLPIADFVLAMNVDFGEIPELNINSPLDLSFSKAPILTVPLELTYHLIAQELQAVTLGGGGFVAVPAGSAHITKGNGYQFHINYEIRGSVKKELIVYYETQNYSIDHKTQLFTELGFKLRFSFWGPQGRTPPPNERGI